jgi:hypothetical protein
VTATGLAVLAVPSCREDSSRPGPAAPTEALARVLEGAAQEPAFRRGGFRSGRYVMRAFVEDYDVATDRAGGFLDVDPFLCAQNAPVSIEYRTPRIAGDSATIVAVMTFGGGVKRRNTYMLERSRARWRLAATSCLPQLARQEHYGKARVISGPSYLECEPELDSAPVHKRRLSCVRARSVVGAFVATGEVPRGWEKRNPAGCEWILGTRAAIRRYEGGRVPDDQPVILTVRMRGCRSRDRANATAPTRPVSIGAGHDASLRGARDRAAGSCPRRRLRPAAVREGLVVPNRGAVGVYLGMSLPRVIGCLGSPLSRSDYGTLSYGARDGIFDVGVVANAVSSLNIAGKGFCLPKRICLQTAGGVARLRRRYGRDVRLTRDESGRRLFTIESTYRGRPVVTAIAFEGAGKLSQVMISWKHEGRPKAGPTLLRQDGVGPLRLGMTRAAALATGWLADRGKGCPLGGPPVPITYRIDRASAPRAIRGIATFVRGRLARMSFSRGVSTAVGVIVGESTVAQMVSRYRKAGFEVTRRFEPTLQATFVTVTHNGEAVLGGFASKNVIELLSIPRTQGCD